jgi:2-phosphosulfolactate phosphatase
MTIDVAFTPRGLGKDEVAGRAVFVIDVLRATTVICAALHHGARAVIPVESVDLAKKLGDSLASTDVLLAGERNGLPIPGFALGNSPAEMTPSQVDGKILVMTTTNGTQALLQTEGAALVYVAAGANLTRAGRRARELAEEGTDILVLCAGRSGAFGLDDAYTAGRLVLEALGGFSARPPSLVNDAALAAVDLARRYGPSWRRPLERSAAGRHLASLGLGADVRDAGTQDCFPILPQYRDRRIQSVAA